MSDRTPGAMERIQAYVEAMVREGYGDDWIINADEWPYQINLGDLKIALLLFEAEKARLQRDFAPEILGMQPRRLMKP